MSARLSLCVYEDTTRSRLIADLSARARRVTMTTNVHGYSTLTCLVPMTLREAFTWYDRPGLPHVVVDFCSKPVWEGRLEDVSIVNEGVALGAFGYWRAYSDLPYTALWSVTSVADWRIITGDDVSTVNESLYQQDNNNRLFVATTKGTAYTSGADSGGYVYVTPDGGLRDIQHVSFTYDYNLPANWTVRASAFDSSFGSAIGTSITTAGGAASGTFTWDISATPRAIAAVRIYNSSGATYTETSETGAHYLKVTSPRLKSTTSSTVQASDIAAGLAAWVNSMNSSQAQASASKIEATGVDLTDEVYADETPADILNRIIKTGDSSGNQLEVGVWSDRYLHLRRRGKYGMAWYVDAATLEVERSLDTLHNSAYVVYQSATGRTLRTASNGNGYSQIRYGVRRRAAVSATTTSSATAVDIRQAYLADNSDPIPRSSITFDRLYDSAGGLYPLWLCRSGDTITIRNLPTSVSAAIDRIRTFTVSETRYDLSNNTLSVVPELPLETLTR